MRRIILIGIAAAAVSACGGNEAASEGSAVLTSGNGMAKPTLKQDVAYAGIKLLAKCGGSDADGVSSGGDEILHTEVQVDGVTYVVEDKWSGDCLDGVTPRVTS